MAQLRRRLLTVYPPMLVDTFCGLQRVVDAEFPGATIEHVDEIGAPFDIFVTEELDATDPRVQLALGQYRERVLSPVDDVESAWKARARELARLRDKETSKKERLYEWIATARERIEQERDATRLTFDDPALTTHQQDMASARAWALDLALQLVDDAKKDTSPDSRAVRAALPGEAAEAQSGGQVQARIPASPPSPGRARTADPATALSASADLEGPVSLENGEEA